MAEKKSSGKVKKEAPSSERPNFVEQLKAWRDARRKDPFEAKVKEKPKD